MTLQNISQGPLSLGNTRKGEIRTQFGAICYRKVKSKPEILLITSRGRGRWLVPKGWPMAGQTPADSAAQEAFEEAGIQGHAHPQCVGIYSYTKGKPGGGALPCVVALYPVEVTRVLRRFPEQGERKRRWFSPKRAAEMVQEPELRQILCHFDPGEFPPALTMRRRRS